VLEPQCHVGSEQASDDGGEESDSTRVPSVPCQESPKARWADILSDDDGPCDPSPLELAPTPEHTKAQASVQHKRKCHTKTWVEKKAGSVVDRAPVELALSRSEIQPHAARNQAWSEEKAPAASSVERWHWWADAEESQLWGGSRSRRARPWDAPAAQTGRRRHSHNDVGGAAWKSASVSRKLQCQFFIGIEEDSKFHVVRRVLGHHGQQMKDIAGRSGAKLRLRGRGSKFLEGPEQQESSDPLMLCVSAPDAYAYAEAKRLTRRLLEGVYAEYRSFCQEAGIPTTELQVQLHEGPREGAY